MATNKELQAEIAALRAEIAAMRAELHARQGWIQVIPAGPATYPYPSYPYVVTATTSLTEGNPAKFTLINGTESA